MKRFVLLWVDARFCKGRPALYKTLAGWCSLQVAHGIDQLTPSLSQNDPDVIVFDFDFPDLEGLRALRKTKQKHMDIPILMLTDYHYTNLVLWALRTRVWDYLIKPVSSEALMQRFKVLENTAEQRDGQRMGEMNTPPPPIPTEARFSQGSMTRHTTLYAIQYIKDHLHEKITEQAMADLCQMSRFEFSRLFKRDHGVNFRSYLLSARLDRAAIMLSQTDAPITEVAFCVGFSDLSHFARLFKRDTGCCPSRYRQLYRPT